jgi:outer membrane protein assembly factor BamB
VCVWAVAWAVVLALGGAMPARADWPHLLGPEHDGVCREKDIAAGSATKVWSASAGTGFASITVAGGKAYTMGHDGSQDQVVCFDAASGRVAWRHGYPAPVEARSYEGGPNATPTVHQGRVYALGRQGQVVCLDAATGQLVWQKAPSTFGAEPPTWGFSSAPTIVGDSVVMNVGSRGAALHKDTGAVLWNSGGSGAGYASGVPSTAGAARDPAVALFTSAGLQLLDARTGAPFWSFDWSTSFEVNAASPTPVPGGYFVSTGYGTGCARVDASTGQPRQVWRNRSLSSHFNTCALADGYIYGIDGNAGRRCALVCVSAGDGGVAWRQETGFGTVRLADGKLFFLSESGMLFVVKASSRSYQEVSRHRILGGKCWSVPTITNKRLYARNAAGDAVCFQLEGGALTVDPLEPDRDINLGY